MANSDVYKTIALNIVKQQELVVGSLAWIEADKVSGLKVKDHDLSITADGKNVLKALVSQYEKLFGQASVEVCKGATKAAASKIDNNLLPKILQV